MQYDLIGDVHGHFDLLERLVEKLGYTRTRRGYEHRDDRKLVFVGDLINRGPDSLSVLKTVKESKSLKSECYEFVLEYLRELPIELCRTDMEGFVPEA